jgi:hypothetical protein
VSSFTASAKLLVSGVVQKNVAVEDAFHEDAANAANQITSSNRTVWFYELVSRYERSQDVESARCTVAMRQRKTSSALKY